MRQTKPLAFSSEMFLYPLFMVLFIWIVFWLELRFDLKIRRWGIYPLRASGLRGIVFGPFLHANLQHLFNNSVPLLVLSTALFYFYRKISWKVLLFGTLVTGLLTWCIGRPSLHIGASGVVYMLASFLFFKGVLSKQYQLTAMALIVVFLYGGLLWYLFPIDPKISWEGHLSGFLVGAAFGVLFKSNPLENPKYDWEHPDFDPTQDAFMRHFDEDGNFVPVFKEEDVLITSEIEANQPRVKITYVFRSLETNTEEE